jgi:hypothetical protein
MHGSGGCREVVIVRLAITDVAELIATALVEPKLSVGTSTAPDGVDVKAAVSVTVPVNPFAGVTSW